MNKLQNVYVIIAAAGSGTRFNNFQSKSLPKQFLNLKGIPIIVHSLLKFQRCKYVKGIYITVDYKYYNSIINLKNKFKITKLIKIIKGGKTRFQSVKNAFKDLICYKDDIIIIHDAARPNITNKDINNLINESFKFGEVILTSAIADTIKYVKNHYVKSTISRDDLFTAQTPQAFRYSVLLKSYNTAGNNMNFTDEAALVEQAGFRIKTILGNRYNIKITTKEDLIMLNKLK